MKWKELLEYMSFEEVIELMGLSEEDVIDIVVSSGYVQEECPESIIDVEILLQKNCVETDTGSEE